PRCPTPGDLDVGPADTSPARAHRLHDRLFAGEAGGQATGGFGEPESVLPFVVGEAPLREAWILGDQRFHSLDIRQVDAETDYPHAVRLGASGPRPRGRHTPALREIHDRRKGPP